VSIDIVFRNQFFNEIDIIGIGDIAKSFMEQNIPDFHSVLLAGVGNE
jgi:hypothetical protein